MSDDDLIRRGDALAAITSTDIWYEAHEAIAALPLVSAPVAVRVRELVWGGAAGDPEPWEDFGWEQHAKSAVGTYRVLNRKGLWRAVIHCVEDAYFIAETENLEAAKAAAQRDYEARVRAALSTGKADT